MYNLTVFENNFRQAKWGMSKKEVLALEEKFADEIISKDNSIIIPSVTLNAINLKLIMNLLMINFLRVFILVMKSL